MSNMVTVKIDRPLGSRHPEHTDMVYPVNYGYIEGVIAPDGEEQDAYILGVDEPLSSFTGVLYAIIHRKNDIENKWVVVPEGYLFTIEQIAEKVHFQEQFFDIDIELVYNNQMVFGKRESVVYTDRVGAYLIPIKDGKAAVVKTPKGFFLLGGGIEDGESDIACIERECLEETGFKVEVGEQICSAETFCINSRLGYFHPVQRYYTGTLVWKIQEPIEKDHELVWAECENLIGNMFSEMQGWAIEQAINIQMV